MNEPYTVPFEGYCDDCDREVRRTDVPKSDAVMNGRGQHGVWVRCSGCETIVFAVIGTPSDPRDDPIATDGGRKIVGPNDDPAATEWTCLGCGSSYYGKSAARQCCFGGDPE